MQPPVTLVEELRREFTKDNTKGGCFKGKGESQIHAAVRNATFSVEVGEVFGLLGPNGAGKTTLLNMVIAETSPTKGKVSWTKLLNCLIEK